jgi:hypothetical protein
MAVHLVVMSVEKESRLQRYRIRVRPPQSNGKQWIDGASDPITIIGSCCGGGGSGSRSALTMTVTWADDDGCIPGAKGGARLIAQSHGNDATAHCTWFRINHWCQHHCTDDKSGCCNSKGTVTVGGWCNNTPVAEKTEDGLVVDSTRADTWWCCFVVFYFDTHWYLTQRMQVNSCPWSTKGKRSTNTNSRPWSTKARGLSTLDLPRSLHLSLIYQRQGRLISTTMEGGGLSTLDLQRGLHLSLIYQTTTMEGK